MNMPVAVRCDHCDVTANLPYQFDLPLAIQHVEHRYLQFRSS
jgi:hypothetical protein